jgi:hypothetical protein
VARSKSVMPRVKAERHFPVRIRVRQPPNGFGQRLTEMHHWLHTTVGLKRFYQWGERSAGACDCLLFYFDDLEIAKAFVTRFDCAVLVSGDPPP